MLRSSMQWTRCCRPLTLLLILSCQKKATKSARSLTSAPQVPSQMHVQLQHEGNLLASSAGYSIVQGGILEVIRNQSGHHSISTSSSLSLPCSLYVYWLPYFMYIGPFWLSTQWNSESCSREKQKIHRTM